MTTRIPDLGEFTVLKPRVSRPCYDKMHRCPGWAGGGMRWATKVARCDSGSLGDDIYQGRLWMWRVNRCAICGVYVLPSVVRWADPRWLRYLVVRWVREVTSRG